MSNGQACVRRELILKHSVQYLSNVGQQTYISTRTYRADELRHGGRLMSSEAVPNGQVPIGLLAPLHQHTVEMCLGFYSTLESRKR